MAEVTSTGRLALGAQAPDFELRDASGQSFALDEMRGTKGVVVAFVCNHCPFVVHLAKSMGEFAKECAAQGVAFVAINSNNAEKYPSDAPERMPTFAEASGWDFPYLVDAEQSVALAYSAACTPDFFLFDADLKLVYCGQYDASRPGNSKPVDGSSLRAAVNAMVTGSPPVQPQLPSSGCSIKWRPGNEPDYY